MSTGYPTLTEKEKQTLRLLIDGHDAKSIARALELSVHTVNERLRAARRKMAVSSSREAARLLRDVEDAGHKSFGDKPLRGAATEEDMSPVAEPEREQRGSGRLIGGIVMSIALAFLAVAAVTDQASPPVAPVQTAAAESAPTMAARHWLELGDRKDWAGSYAATAASFRSVNTSENWQKAAVSVRVPLGPVVARTLVSEVEAPTPPAGNVIVRFRTDFANKTGVFETVALAREESDWRVVGIYVE